MIRTWIRFFLLLFFLSCSADPLTIEDVSNIDPGDAMGNQYTGSYTAGITLQCNEDCEDDNGELADACEPGTFPLEISQQDGRLNIQAPLINATGSVGTDGTYKIGASISLQGMVVFLLMEGDMPDAGQRREGTARARIREGDIDCSADGVVSLGRL